jgi:hypothetical protein
MFIHNVRYGFATNSSSTHSICLISKDEKIVDSHGQEFGWNFFTCSSENAKRRYMGQTIKSAFEMVHGLSEEDAATIASKWSGIKISPSGYIDHQSNISIPCKLHWGRLRIRKDFFDDLLRFVLKPEIVILGGNDNEENSHPLIESGKARNILKSYWNDEAIGNPVLRLLVDSNSESLRARYDKTGKFWSLFCSSSGTKIRTSFLEDANAEKSEVPELVDIKITDYCKKGCSFCYQGSTPKGKHASKDMVHAVCWALEKLETFEVALGGGEPTEHPDLIGIINDFHSSGIVVNLTTRNEQWVIDNWPKIKGKVGAIGLSVDNHYKLLDQLSKLTAAKDELALGCEHGLKVTVQVVVGSCSMDSLRCIFDLCKAFHITVLLLGWKNTHRGSKGPSEEIDLVKLLDGFWGMPQQGGLNGETYTPWEGPSVSFDTMLVNELKCWLEAHASKWNFTTREGAHSMYIDCVAEIMCKSSYQTEGFVSLVDKQDPLEKHIQKYFSTI